MKAYVVLFIIGSFAAGIGALYINNCGEGFSNINYELENTIAGIRLLLEKQLDFCQSPDESADIASLISLVATQENLVAINDSKGFLGNFVEIIEQLKKLQYDTFSEVQKQTIAFVLEEGSKVYNLLYNNLATLYDLTDEFEHIEDLFLQGLKIDYNDSF